MLDRLLNAREVAEILHVSPATVLAHSGPKAVAPVLACVKIGGRKLYRQPDVRQFIEDCLVRHATKFRVSA